jgi:hypothetical protein
MNTENPLPSGAARHEMAGYIGELVMQNICSVAHARELERENEELRKLVTEARADAQHWQGEAERRVTEVNASVVDLTNAQDELGRLKAPKPRPSRTRAKS